MNSFQKDIKDIFSIAVMQQWQWKRIVNLSLKCIGRHFIYLVDIMY